MSGVNPLPDQVTAPLIFVVTAITKGIIIVSVISPAPTAATKATAAKATAAKAATVESATSKTAAVTTPATSVTAAAVGGSGRDGSQADCCNSEYGDDFTQHDGPPRETVFSLLFPRRAVFNTNRDEIDRMDG
jgi:hypothetical protein